MKDFSYLGIRCVHGRLEVLDQRALPDRELWLPIENPEEMIRAIRSLTVRGAPLIGVAAALSLAAYIESGASEPEVQAARAALREARPTAVNLMWAMDQMGESFALGREDSIARAELILEEEASRSEAMAQNGAALIADGEGIITHCNTGGLATVGVGTALGAILRAHASGKRIHVYVDETRPLLQGGRLTTWELARAQVPHTLICDSMAAVLLREGRVQRAFVGADRIALNGDFANKIGTYGLAVQAKFHGVPFHPVAPISTVDFSCASGHSIPIEERPQAEVMGTLHPESMRWAPEGTKVWNPSFDVTPVEFVTSMVFDLGVFTSDQLHRGELGRIARSTSH